MKHILHFNWYTFLAPGLYIAAICRDKREIKRTSSFVWTSMEIFVFVGPNI